MSIRDAGQVRGYSTDESPLRTDIASSTPAYNQGTLVKTSLNRDGLEVLSNVYTQLVAADSVDSYAAGVITAASHSAKVGDVILFTSGVLNKIVFTIFATATNTISLAQTPVSAPSAADTFNILRFAHPIIDSSGNVGVSGTVTAAFPTAVATTPIYNEYAFGSITGSYTTALTNSADGKILDISNGTDKDLLISFNASTAHMIARARSTKIIDLKIAGLKVSSNISVKNNGVAPTVGSLFITLHT